MYNTSHQFQASRLNAEQPVCESPWRSIVVIVLTENLLEHGWPRGMTLTSALVWLLCVKIITHPHPHRSVRKLVRTQIHVWVVLFCTLFCLIHWHIHFDPWQETYFYSFAPHKRVSLPRCLILFSGFVCCCLFASSTSDVRAEENIFTLICSK